MDFKMGVICALSGLLQYRLQSSVHVVGSLVFFCKTRQKCISVIKPRDDKSLN